MWETDEAKLVTVFNNQKHGFIICMSERGKRHGITKAPAVFPDGLDSHGVVVVDPRAVFSNHGRRHDHKDARLDIFGSCCFAACLGNNRVEKRSGEHLHSR